MPRKGEVPKRKVLPDPKFTDAPSDHLTSGLIVYLTVSGSSLVFSYVPKSVLRTHLGSSS